VTPVVRSFVSIPAGVAKMPLLRFTVLTFLGCVPWCFGIAGAGYALGTRYEEFHHNFRYADYTVAALLVVAAVVWYVRRRRTTKLARRASDPAR
jgi:membrane protein DedA with SNARE-associated domain